MTPTARNKQIDSGEVLETASNGFGSETQTLVPGTYYVRVSPRFSSFLSTRYDLSLVATPKPSNLNTDPGETLSGAPSVGILNQLPTSTFIARDYVGVQDAGDAFRFDLTETRTVNVRITSDNWTQAALIFDANGNGLVDPGDTLATAGSISSSGTTRSLAPGSYFVLVTP
ncbi:MAG: hypothetical protein IGR76_09960, partial [Synechococcales cyanobacterium T60_A2020_003]|nr:hypothetical protein [Synechococcales cyanobacterium T60_A2020_003]